MRPRSAGTWRRSSARGSVYEAMRDLREAITWYQQYVDMRPGFWGNPEMIEHIEELKKKLEETPPSGE